MPPQNQPSEQPTGDLRQEVLTNASTMLDNMREQIDAAQRERVLEMIKDERLSEESLKKIDMLLDSAQREYEKDPTKALQILDAMIEAGSDGEISAEDIQGLLQGAIPETPEALSKISGMIEKMTTMANQLGEQLGSLGSGTIKMLAGFFGPETLFGKVFAMLKDQPKAQIAYLEKKLLQQNKTLSPETTHEQIVNLLKGQIVQGQNIERRGKQPPTYDIVQHVEQLMAVIDPSKDKLALDDFKTAGEQVIANYTTEIAGLAATPAPAIAATATERIKQDVTTKVETKIAEDDAMVISVEKITDGANIEINGREAAIKKIGNTPVVNVALLEARSSDPAAVIVTLTDGVNIQIDATELKKGAIDKSKQPINIKAKNLATKSDVSFEILFA